MLLGKYLFLGILLSLFIGAVVSPSADTIDVEYYAVVIGVEKYEFLNFTAHYIDEDAIRMYNKLIGNNWEEDHVRLLLNENATKNGIKDAIDWLDSMEDEDDIVLFYFSGHGWEIPSEERENGYAHIVPYDALDWHYSEGVITDKELDSWLDELESNHVVVILDSCYSGRMFSICEKDRVVLTAGGRFLLCPVSESDELKSGIFTYFLLEGFNGSADKNNDGWISAEEVFHYARMPTFKFSFWKQFPFVRFNPYFYVIPPQLPYIYDKCSGEVLSLIHI